MNVQYQVEIMNPKTHMVNVKVKIPCKGVDELKVFLPSWSPGSYLMREYAKNIRSFRVFDQQGEFLKFIQEEKGLWSIDIKNSDIKNVCTEILIDYEVYCHELTVRTSHIDESHAYLHGPSYLIGVFGEEITPTISFKFSPLWAKIHTGLKEISAKRDEFIFTAESYDVLLDTPVEIGCHESDGFMFDEKEHHLIWYGESYPHDCNLKKDIQTIVETVASHFSSVPYDKYLFITHLKKDLYGGLEHLNSTALHFDGRKLNSREDYVNWLALVAHEYFHTWNVKRIRPIELGPFNYLSENYTTMHWLTEGLTSFMDEVFVLRASLCSLEEYLKMQTKNLQRHFDNFGKKFQSLEESSFTAWTKFYRPDENSNNTGISYYLKGGLVFSTLHFELKKQGKSINDLLQMLWQRYLDNPEVGMIKEEVMNMIEDLAGKKVRDLFDLRISTTEDIDFETYYKEIGLEFVWESSEAPNLGIDCKFAADRVYVDKVHLDGPGYKGGLNAGDEILAINNQRVLKSDIDGITKILIPGKKYQFLVSRLGTLISTEVLVEKKARRLKAIEVRDREKALEIFLN